MKGPFENLELYNYPHWQTENLYDTKTSQELECLCCMSSSDRIEENVLKSCAMWAKKKEPKAWRELIGKHCKKSLQRETPLIRPRIRYWRNSMFKVAANIGTGTVDYWLWIMDQKLRATFGQ